MSHDGKQNNWNAVSHGILTNRILPTEKPEDYEALSESFFARFQPCDPVEGACVRAMVDSTWRIERMLKHEMLLLNAGYELMKAKPEPVIPGDDFKQAAGFDYCATDTQSLNTIIRYESMLRRSFERSYKMLKQLQADRPPQLSDRQKPETREQAKESMNKYRPILEGPWIPAEQAPPPSYRKPLTGDPFLDLPLGDDKLQNDMSCAINKKPRSRAA